MGWGNKYVDIRGPITVWVVGVVAVLATILYGVYRIEHAVERHDENMRMTQASQWRAIEGFEYSRREEMAAFRRRMDIQNCISMFSFEERKAIRNRPQSFAEVCPWIEPEGRRQRGTDS